MGTLSNENPRSAAIHGSATATSTRTGDRDADRGNRVHEPPVQLALVDDVRPEHGGAQHDWSSARPRSVPVDSRSRRTTSTAIATSATGKFRKTSARLAPPSIPLPVTS
jgi:hypothetical protein